MKKILVLLVMLQICVLASGQIVADHTVVDKYDQIPQQWIDAVMTMWVSYAGESHSEGIRGGLNLLEVSNSAYSVSVRESGTPEAYRDDALRVSRATWGDVDNPSGWIYGYGEEDWFTSETAISRTKDGLTYIDANGPELAAFGFGWCWDVGVNFKDYINATIEYINHCETNSIDTKVFFTTGTVDIYDGQDGYIKHLGYEQIRDSVNNDPDRILFDFADILCYDDASETPNTVSWDGNDYPFITSNNLNPQYGSTHISEAGTIRLAKAMWWMLAKIAGWDGIITGIKNQFSDGSRITVKSTSDLITVDFRDEMLLERIVLYNINGATLYQKDVDEHIVNINTVDLSPGIYLLGFEGPGFRGSRKIYIK